MMFFRNFPLVSYEFGDTGISATVENLAIYADVIDQVADATSSYIDYTIQNGQRMDQVCLDLYDAPEYMWTILLLNRNLRELGWPLTNQQAYEKAIELYNHTVITTRTPLTDKLAIGQEISGLTSGQTATIAHRILDYGQLWVEGNVAFRNGETITSQNADGGFENAVVTTVQHQYEAVHHYENADKEWVDIDPTVGPGAQITPITYMDNYIRHNDAQRSIKVFKPSVINDIVESFFEAIR
jgi:hypothetical protein